MPRGNPQHLVPLNKRSKKEAQELGRKGGIKSGEIRRAKKEAKEQLKILNGSGLIQELLSASTPEKVQKKIQAEFGDSLPNGVKLTNEIALIIRQMHEGIVKGNLSSTQFLMDRAYGKAVDKQEITGSNGGAIEIKQEIDIQEIEKLKNKLDKFAK